VAGHARLGFKAFRRLADGPPSYTGLGVGAREKRPPKGQCVTAARESATSAGAVAEALTRNVP
jgi:hypothetical protein